jgi:hypothetical protein
MEQAALADIPSYARYFPRGTEDGFSRMLQAWSSEGLDSFNGSDAPVYNR